MNSFAQPLPSAQEERDVCAPAALVCAIGVFLRLFLSDPTLNMLGIPYGEEGGGLLSKLHPGTYFFLASFLILLFRKGNPADQLMRMARQYSAYFSFLIIYVLIIIYWGFRSTKGIGVVIDVHLVMPICALVFSYAPRHYCKRIVYAYAAFAVVNSAIGIGEALTHKRIFPFSPDWEVLVQEYFRASAFMGHPLTNAIFTATSFFIVLNLRMPSFVKVTSFVIMLFSLVAFGGRSALFLCVVGLIILGVIQIVKSLRGGNWTVMRMILGVPMVLLIPLFCVGMLYAGLHSEMGERIMAYNSLQDESANVRVDVVHVFDHVSSEDVLFGADSDRISALGNQVGVGSPTSDIENPWILMFLFLGIFLFPLWLGGLAATIWQLMAGATPALQIAIVEYFAIASTSNSFARQDPGYVLLAALIVCSKIMSVKGFVKHHEMTP